ncbi:MAG TPA: hypothetical protein VF541_22745 [Longimicrobium sp.]|jgi:hypothetical protein
MDLGLCKEFYDHEVNSREQLHSAANTPISIVTLLSGGLLWMAKTFGHADPALSWSFWAGAGVAAVFIAATVYCVIRSIHGYRYERVPHASDLAVHYANLSEYYTREGKPGLADRAFEDYLMKQYILAGDRNAVNNANRSEYLYRANRWLVYGLSATAVAAVPAGIAAEREQEQPQAVRVTNLRSDASEALNQWRGCWERCGSGQPRSDAGDVDRQPPGRAGEHRASHGPETTGQLP